MAFDDIFGTIAGAAGDIFGATVGEAGNILSSVATRSAKKFLGGLIGDGHGAYLRDSRHATYNFGLRGSYIQQNYPRSKFQYLVKINYNTIDPVKSFVDTYLNRDEQDMIVPLIKRIDMPSMQIDTEKLNQYNKWRISQTKIKFQPITMVLHDVVDGKTLRFWEMYYEYYFNDGVYAKKTSDSISNFDPIRNTLRRGELNVSEFYNDIISKEGVFKRDFGFRLDTQVFNTTSFIGKYSRYLFDSIDIYQVHGQSYSRARLVNPRITDFRHDALAYDNSSDLMELTFTFEYEDVVYDNFVRPLAETELEFYDNANNLELDYQPARPPVSVRVRNDSTEGGFGRSSSGLGNVLGDITGDIFGGIRSGVSTVLDATGVNGVLDNIGVGAVLGNAANSVLGNIERNVTDYVTTFPENAARAVGESIFTGEVEFPVDPKGSMRKILDQAKSETTGTIRRTFETGVNTAITGVLNGAGKIIDNPRGSRNTNVSNRSVGL